MVEQLKEPQKRVYCACCGRQIVDYDVDTDRIIGQHSHGGNCLFLGPNKWACPTCAIVELQFGEEGQ